MAALTTFLDSNVLFSIAWSGPEKSRAYLLYELQREGLLKLFISRLVMEENIHNVTNKKIGQRRFLDTLLRHTTILPDIFATGDLPAQLKALPENDRIILATALWHRIAFFLTGNDRDFAPFYDRQFGQTLILKPAMFLRNPP